MLISIIANFYKCERFIPKLMESVAQQTFTDWELVCVVDASPGNDVEVIEQCAKRLRIEPKVRVVVNATNLGISRSKKVGIDAAQGTYLTFMDGDDFLANEALERMAEPAIRHGVDFVNMNYCRYYAPLRKQVDICVPFNNDEYERVMLKREFFDRCFINFFGAFFIGFPYWAKLYRASMLKELEFDYPAQGDTVAEDKWFNMEVFQHIESAYFLRYVGYYWRWGGISSVRVDRTWSLARDLEKHIEFFPKQCALIEKYNYRKAYLPLVNTLKTKLIDAIAPMAAYKPSSPKAQDVKDYIAECIDTEPMSRLGELRPIATSRQMPLIEAVANKDAEEVYRIMHELYRSEWRLRWSRYIFHKLLYRFR